MQFFLSNFLTKKTKTEKMSRDDNDIGKIPLLEKTLSPSVLFYLQEERRIFLTFQPVLSTRL